MIPEHLVKKYNYTYVQSCNLLNEPFVKDLLESKERVDKMNRQLLSKLDNYDHIVDERDELKSQLKGTTHCYDEVEHKQLEEQQQEFIKYLEDKIHTIETTYSQINGNYGLMNEKLETLKEILQKYKGIIGIDINVGSKGVKDGQ